MKCRAGCAACCVEMSISSYIPGMPNGKPAGIRCIHLTDENLCGIFGRESRPEVCRNLKPAFDMCGETDEYAYNYLRELEVLTREDKRR